MSYDLILQTAKRRRPHKRELERLRSRVAGSEALSRCEVLDYIAEGNTHLLTVCLTGDKVMAEAAYAELMAVAKEFGLKLHDPQAGAVVDLDNGGRLPKMY